MIIRADLTESPEREHPTCAQDVSVPIRKPGKASPRRGGSNVLLSLLLAGAAYAYFVYVKTGPQTASAAESTANTSAVRTFVAAAPANIKGMERLLKSTRKSVAQLSTFQNVRQVPLADLRINPFGGSDASSDNPQTDQAAKARADQQRSTALRAVKNLQLQSVWIDDKNRSCVINNAILLEGQQVDQFTVESISAGAVVVRTGAFRFELRSQR